MNAKPLSIPSRTLLVASVGFAAYGLAGFQKPPVSPNPTPDQVTFFETKIRPVLANSCFGCHGKDVQLAGLRLDSYTALLKGGESGPAIIPGSPEKSLLITAVHQNGKLKMPQGGKLKANEIADLEAWVKMGAIWPNGTATKKADPSSFWSLQPVKKSRPPKVKHTTWVRNPIDAFILAKVESQHLVPNAEADRRTLIRRLSYDLIGLPPSPAEVDAFLGDKSANAYEKLVDRLLSSPRYGERWARRWMDVARYADTKGYVFEEDRTYHNAYTYRTWLINAFNKDLPYDQFITQQLAADRLPEVQNGDDKTALAALGFLNIGRRFLNSQPDIIDDRIDVTMRGFQGFTVACARCHDHKFDPIPTQDYYSLYSIFASSNEVAAPISEKSIRDPWESYSRKLTATESTARDLVAAQMKRLRQISKDPAEAAKLSEEVKKTLMGLREETPATGKNLEKLSVAFEAPVRERLSVLEKEIEGLKKNAPPMPEFAMAMMDSPNPRDGVVFKRGNPGNPGPVAPRRFLLALTKPNMEREHWTKSSGRLELAQSIASKDNPLTARVFVNRIWQDHFGAGIVRTPSDFGKQGEKPTHPELLDYLASTFMENEWSIKKLHRLIVTSATYRQSSAVSPAIYNADPDNRLWARTNRRRLDLEQMRDSVLVASGQIDLSTLGGKSVDLWSTPFTVRRAVYGFVERQNLPGIFRTFDFASPDSTSARRFMTTVPQQALFFMNSPFAVEEAKLVSSRDEIKNSADDAQRVRRMYRILFSRLPDKYETDAALNFTKLGEVTAPAPVWQAGYGGFDAATSRVTGFTPLTFFGNDSYRVGAAFPDPKLGYLVLNSQGGHPGHDAAHSIIRRWVAPSSMTVRITGTFGHGQEQGDGVHGRIVSSAKGVLGEWSVHHSKVEATVPSVMVSKGDTIDFIVDPIRNDGFDAFNWAPVIRKVGAKQAWDSAKDFGHPEALKITRLGLLAQALMMTNEFLFVD